MKKLLFIISIMAMPLMAIGQEFRDTLQTVPLNAFYSPEFGYLNQKQAEITYKDSSGFYVIKFNYNDSYCSIPATYPAGCPHYSAIITVYEVTDGDTVVIGKPFSGTYTGGKCYEDEPAGLIDQVKNQIENLKIAPAKDGKLQLKSADSTATLLAFGTGSLRWEITALCDSIASPKPVYDTIPVIMLVCDTTMNVELIRCEWKSEKSKNPLVVIGNRYIEFKNTFDYYKYIRDLSEPEQPDTVMQIRDDKRNTAFWLRGYEVRKRGFSENPSDPGSLIYNAHAAYLDSNKQPVKHLVWMSKEVKK